MNTRFCSLVSFDHSIGAMYTQCKWTCFCVAQLNVYCMSCVQLQVLDKKQLTDRVRIVTFRPTTDFNLDSSTLDDMGKRVDELEHSINDLMKQVNDSDGPKSKK